MNKNIDPPSHTHDPKVPARETLLQVLRATGKALSLDALADATGAGVPPSTGFVRRIKAMERDGQLRFNSQGRVLLRPEASVGFVTGTVQGHRDGYGFLLTDDGERHDLYLSPFEMGKVLHGDRVQAKPLLNKHARPEAAIVQVLERRTEKLVGRLVHEHGSYLVVPEDQRIKHDILIAPHDLGAAEPGQVVTAQILRQPASHVQPSGRILEVLGAIDDPGMEIEIAVRKFKVPVEFSAASQAQITKIPTKVAPKELKGRVDLRDIPFITIDGADARDFDDAVFCAPADLGTGKRSRPGWRLLVAIADVSHYVKPGAAIDADALERGTSVYFPRRVIPMLPEALSNGICSLNPGADRLVMVCDMTIPAGGKTAGQIIAYQFYEAVIHSHARTTYDDIWAALQQPEGPAAQKLGALLPHVQAAHQLFQALLAARRARGAIDFETTETRIVCNDLGRIETIEPTLRNDAHKLIEECMLAANTCAADFILRNKAAALYRVHERPKPEKVLALREHLRQLGLHLGGGETPQTSDYARLIQEARARPDFEIIQSLCLRSMQQAIYSPDPDGHFGLAYSHYAHFTSPIRRYPDLLVHRVIHAILHQSRYRPPQLQPPAADAHIKPKSLEQDSWQQLGEQLSAFERRADDAARDVVAWLKCWYMREHIGEIFSGKISGVTSFGIFVTLDTMYVDGLVHISELGGDYFIFNEAFNELRGEHTGMRYKLGDALQIQVSRVDLDARKIDFRLVRGDSFKSLQAAGAKSTESSAGGKARKKAAGTKPAALRGTTASQRRAQAKKSSAREK